VKGPSVEARRLRQQVRDALEAGEPREATIRAVLELRFPREGDGASLDAAGEALGMSPALMTHIEFAALCAITARAMEGAQGREDVAAA
jgi:hypothetical protein